MHKRFSPGFTILELMIVILTIAVIASITSNAYAKVQQDMRDSKRDIEMTILMHELEAFYDKKGMYPPGCPDPTCPSVLHTVNTASAPLTTTTTLTSLSSILPKIRTKFGDPQSPDKALPFKNRAVNEKKYLYFGGTYNDTDASASLDSASHTNFPCTLRSTLPAHAAGSYVIGYFHEGTNKWILLGGRNATPITVAAGFANDGCIINRL